ncbi:hypothetical protein ACFU7Z_12935 [Kitasatospora sp. NPDC057518]|uniref:hypothetical protein n=1 Tax=Kitasatospora sp. NPDC057518 TaxID=3346155 RepID=UPI00369D36A0
MSYQAMWFLIPAPADVVERHGPRLRALLDAHAADPGNRALRRRWEREGLAPEELEELAVGPLGEDPDGLYAVWEDCGTAGPCAAVQARNRYPVLGLAHGLGPERTAGLPGWFRPEGRRRCGPPSRPSRRCSTWTGPSGGRPSGGPSTPCGRMTSPASSTPSSRSGGPRPRPATG